MVVDSGFILTIIIFHMNMMSLLNIVVVDLTTTTSISNMFFTSPRLKEQTKVTLASRESSSFLQKCHSWGNI